VILLDALAGFFGQVILLDALAGFLVGLPVGGFVGALYYRRRAVVNQHTPKE
jgi:hypothetical protein